MSPLSVPKSTPIAIYGFGIEGQGTLNYLLAQGFSDITIIDQREDLVVPTGAAAILGQGSEASLGAFSIIFRAPGIWRFSPALLAAEAKGARITSQLEVFLHLAPCTVIGVTGTKGKSTTTSLMTHIFREAGVDVYLAGNIGTDMLHLLSLVTPASVVVLELSSFQLDAVGVSPRISIVLDIVEEHQDIHGSLEAYVAAKAEIARHQRVDDILLCAPNNVLSAGIADLSPARTKYSWCTTEEMPCQLPTSATCALTVHHQTILWHHAGKETELLPLTAVPLLGAHMLHNVFAAVLPPLLRGIDPQVVASSVQSFPSVPHRMERLGVASGMTFYNDSAATTPEAAMAAIDAHEPYPMVLILGGGLKGVSLEPLARKAAKANHVRHIILLGTEAASVLKGLFAAEPPLALLHEAGAMEDCDAILQKISEPGLRVVLSPGCASFDIFSDYKARGDAFRQLYSRFLAHHPSGKKEENSLDGEQMNTYTTGEHTIT